jgi:long-chain acyl-CoA synthetase
LKPYPYYKTRPVGKIKDLITYAYERTPEKDAFRVRVNKDSYRGISWRQFAGDVDALGTALVSRGFKGKHICVIGENCYEWVLTYLAVVCGVGVIVPLDKEQTKEKLLEHIRFADGQAVFFTKRYEAMMAELQKELPGEMLFVCMNNEDAAFTPLGALLAEGGRLVDGGDRSYLDAQVDNESLAAILFTSGTSAESKGVMLSHKNLIASFDGACKHVSYTEDDVMLSVLPLHHAYEMGCGIFAMLHTSTVVCFNENLKLFLSNLQLFQPTGMAIVPLIAETMYRQIMDGARKKGKLKKLMFGMKLSNFLLKLGIDIREKLFAEVHEQLGGRLKKTVVGGSAMNPRLTAKFRALGITMLHGYGITECAPLVAVNRERYYVDASTGPVLPVCEVKSVDGEIWVKGDNVMMGYYKNEKETAQAFSADGWFKTGDLGGVKDGFLHITGRKKNLIILSSGENVSPEELEEYIGELAAVKEVVVYAKNDVITAAVFPDPAYVETNGMEDVKALINNEIDTINKKLPMYKQVGSIVFREEEFEKTTTNKIKRHQPIEEAQNV